VQEEGLTVQGTASRPAAGATQLSQTSLTPAQLPEGHVPMAGATAVIVDPVTGLPVTTPTITDALGQFFFEDVPEDFSLEIIVEGDGVEMKALLGEVSGQLVIRDVNGFTTLGAELVENMIGAGLAIEALLTPDMLGALEDAAMAIDAGNLPDFTDQLSVHDAALGVLLDAADEMITALLDSNSLDDAQGALQLIITDLALNEDVDFDLTAEQMTDLIESFAQLQVGTGMLSLDSYLGALDMLGFSFDSSEFVGALSDLYADMPSLGDLGAPGSISAFDALIGSALLGGPDLIGELSDLADLFSDT